MREGWRQSGALLRGALLLLQRFVHVALRSFATLRLSRLRSCADFGCGSSRVAASGGQGGPGGLRFPPRPSLDSPLPLETPPLRYGVGGGRAPRSYAALCRRGNGLGMPLRVLPLTCGFRGGVLAPMLPEQAATGCILSQNRSMNVVILSAEQRTQHSAASIPLAERRRYKGVPENPRRE